jgi:hypothetical protein
LRAALGISLSQLEVVDEESREAVEDWHYWTKKGYQF